VIALCAFFMGLSVVARFPSGVFAASLLAWLAFCDRTPKRHLGLFVTVLWIPFGIEALLDRWGYGEWALPLWNYFRENLISGRSHEFGTAPFFAYLYLPLFNPLFILVIPLMFATLLAWARWPHHLFTWVAVAYVAVHSAIAHKETRFLFPIAMLAPFWIAMAAQPGKNLEKARRAVVRFSESRFFWCLVAINLIALVYLAITPTRKETALQRRIHLTNPTRVAIATLNAPHPFKALAMQMHFYRPRETAVTELKSEKEIELFHLNWCLSGPKEPSRVLIGGGTTITSQVLARCHVEYETYPEFFVRWEPFRIEKRPPEWRSYLCLPETCP
jgi:phosphatidylinositol glycan class B